MKFYVSGLIFLTSFFLAACADAADPPTPEPSVKQEAEETLLETPSPVAVDSQEDKLVIGAILFQNDNFFETVALGMEDAADEAGADILFRFHEQDVALETRWIEAYTEQGVDAIVISPRVKDGSIAAIQAAYEAGIKIICFNGCFTEEATDAYVSAVFETDQYTLGYQTGEYLADWLEKQGFEEPYMGFLSCCERRNAGFNQALADRAVVWHEVSNIEAYIADEATAVGETLLQNDPQITILWAENEGGTVGAVSAVRNQGLAGQVFVFGIDISPQLAQMLLDDDNILQAVGAQSPYLIGQLAVKAAIDAVNENGEAGHHFVTGSFYSRDDLEAVASYLDSIP